MVVYVGIACCLDRQIKQAVLGKQRQHVIEERHTRVDLRNAAAVNGESQHNIGLRCLAGDGRYAFGITFCHASRVSRRTRISSSVPTLMRRNDAVKAWLGKYRTNTLREERKSYAAFATAGPVSPRAFLGSVKMKFASDGYVNQPHPCENWLSHTSRVARIWST